MGLENRADPARRGVIPAEGLFVIDKPAQVEHLIAQLKAALPLSATVSPSMLAQLQEQTPAGFTHQAYLSLKQARNLR